MTGPDLTSAFETAVAGAALTKIFDRADPAAPSAGRSAAAIKPGKLICVCA
jgi:hypothetical protein